jgi:hypothetical protein
MVGLGFHHCYLFGGTPERNNGEDYHDRNEENDKPAIDETCGDGDDSADNGSYDVIVNLVRIPGRWGRRSESWAGRWERRE